MAVRRDLPCFFIILSVFATFTLSKPLNSINSTLLSLPQPYGSLEKSREWPPGPTYDEVPGKEDISLIINSHHNLPKHPTQMDQDVKDLRELISALSKALKPDKIVAPKSQCWHQNNHYVKAEVCVKMDLTVQELVNILSELYVLVGKYGPADLSVDIIIDNTVVAFLMLDFEEGSIT